jgi:osmotically-inducible protein OsmY
MPAWPRVVTMNSERLRRYIREELAADPRFDASGVDVSVDDRVVTLAGHVPSYMDRWAIRHAVLALKGVRGVSLDIDVHCPVGCAVADDDIARRAISRLNSNSAVPHEAVSVAVDNGWVTLDGTVDWQFQRALAERDIELLAGVTGITNNIALRPLPPRGNVRGAIEEAIKRRADVAAHQIRVSVDDQGGVTLHGKVDDCLQRTALEEAVWAVAGVRRVDDRIKVR